MVPWRHDVHVIGTYECQWFNNNTYMCVITGEIMGQWVWLEEYVMRQWGDGSR